MVRRRRLALLAETAALVRAAGYRPGNVSIQLIGVGLGDRRVEAEDVLTAAVGAPVSLSATTTDGLGLTGRDEGLAAVATALVLAGDRRPDEGGTHGDLG